MTNKAVELIDNNHQALLKLNDKLDETPIDDKKSVINFKSNDLRN